MRTKNLLDRTLIAGIFCLAFVAQTANIYAQTTDKANSEQAKQARIVSEIGQIKIHFKSRSASVSSDSRPKIMTVADVFRQLPANSLMEIASYADNSENKGKSEDLNIKLSAARSEAVKNELVKLGVDAATLTVKGYGSAEPAADNSTPVGRAMNRRTEFKITFIGSTTSPTAAEPAATPTPAEPLTNPCPDVYVSSAESVTPGATVTFTANVSGGDPRVTPTYNWFISDGEIISGQGTSSISVSTTNLKAGTSITATLDVGGFERSCSTSESGTTQIKPK